MIVIKVFIILGIINVIYLLYSSIKDIINHNIHK